MKEPNLLAVFLQTRRVCTDTRKIQPGDLFFALKGPNFNGNLFAAKALESGAAKVVVDEAGVIPSESSADYILVEDVLLALQNLARRYRETFDIPILGLTGSNGKTTTKELIYSILSQEKRTHTTQGNLNNHIGVPLTLLAMPDDAEIAVIEMGANKPGDIGELSEIARPTCGFVTNIGQAHLELFRDIEGVKKTKGELYDFLQEQKGLAWVNLDDNRVAGFSGRFVQERTYGSVASADYQLKDWKQGHEHASLQIFFRDSDTTVDLRTSLIGSHNMQNILAAVAVCDTLGISRQAIEKGVWDYVSTNNRTEFVKRSGYTLLMDAYNANPSSMRAAVQSAFQLDHKRVALILGDMFELGEKSPEYHRELGEYINPFQPEITIGIGKEMKSAIDALKGKAVWYESVEVAGPELKQQLGESEIVLVKGSRGMALERVLLYL